MTETIHRKPPPSASLSLGKREAAEMILLADRRSRQIEHPQISSPGFAGNSDIFFAAVALTRMPMLVTDPNLPDNPVAFANQAFCALTGYAPPEITGRNCRFLQGPDTDPATVARIRSAVAARGDIAVELLNYRRDGSPFWNALFISPVFASDGHLQYFFASQLDVSRRREAERALAQAQRLEGLGALAGGVAHEFNNLLTVMRGNLEPLLRAAADSRTLVRLNRVRDAAERATLLTRSMVSFARRQRLQDQRLELTSLVRTMQADLARMVGPDCLLRLDLPPAQVPVRADPEQLRTALINILLNARDATPQGGEVRVAIALRQMGERRPPEVELSVADVGRGMAPEVAARAMDPFFTTKQPGAGAGLGLSMAYGFMRQSGGRLELTSRAGEGTVVRMVFPGRPALPPLLPRGRPGETVLLVDSDPDVRLLAVAVLEDLGYTVSGCGNADDALVRAAQEEPLDLLLTDAAMPGMTGAELAARVQRLRPGAAVLLSSGHPGAGEDVMAKPFGLLELAWRVREALDRATSVSSG